MSIEVADGDLIKFRRVGEHFKYLGVDMIVACFLRAPRGVIGSGRWDTIMLAHYIGGHQIRSMEFTQSMMNALISENDKRDPRGDSRVGVHAIVVQDGFYLG